MLQEVLSFLGVILGSIEVAVLMCVGMVSLWRFIHEDN